jgi:hypothetical protein
LLGRLNIELKLNFKKSIEKIKTAFLDNDLYCMANYKSNLI